LSLLTSGATNPTGPDNAADVAALAALNPLSLLGCAAFGLSLTQIHIYVTEIKRAIQVRAGQGVGGGVVQQCVVSLNRPSSSQASVFEAAGALHQLFGCQLQPRLGRGQY